MSNVAWRAKPISRARRPLAWRAKPISPDPSSRARHQIGPRRAVAHLPPAGAELVAEPVRLGEVSRVAGRRALLGQGDDVGRGLLVAVEQVRQAEDVEHLAQVGVADSRLAA